MQFLLERKQRTSHKPSNLVLIMKRSYLNGGSDQDSTAERDSNTKRVKFAEEEEDQYEEVLDDTSEEEVVADDSDAGEDDQEEGELKMSKFSMDSDSGSDEDSFDDSDNQRAGEDEEGGLGEYSLEYDAETIAQAHAAEKRREDQRDTAATFNDTTDDMSALSTLLSLLKDDNETPGQLLQRLNKTLAKEKRQRGVKRSRWSAPLEGSATQASIDAAVTCIDKLTQLNSAANVNIDVIATSRAALRQMEQPIVNLRGMSIDS